MDHSLAPHVSHHDQRRQRRQKRRQQQQGQMYPDDAVQTQYRRPQQHRQDSRRHVSWREDGTPAPAQIHSRPAPGKRQHYLPERNSDSEWTPRRGEVGSFQPRQIEELPIRGDRYVEHQHQDQERHEHDYSTRSPRRWQHEGDSQEGMTTMELLEDIPSATESKTALGFIMNQGIMNQGEHLSAGFEWVDDDNLTHFFCNRYSRRPRTSSRIIPSVEVQQAPHNPREECKEEEKQSIQFASSDDATYSLSLSQSSRSSSATTNRRAELTVNTRTERRAFMETTHARPPPAVAAAAEITRGRTDIAATGKVRAKPRVRPVPSGTSKEKRRARECKIDGCPNYLIDRGFCFHHGGGKKCSEDECTKSAKHAGKCWKHGGSVKCLVETCTRKGKSRGFCWAHGGGKRCAFEGCEKAAYTRTRNYCVTHYELLKDGNVTLEV